MDESGFMLQPVVRRTWAPRGQTPVQYSWDRHDRLSAIAAITLAPRRRRFCLHFQLQHHNIHFDDVMAFIARLHRQLRRPFLLLLDRYSAHRKAVRLLQATRPEWFEVEWLPAYAPELNPVEMVWNRTKYADLANFLPFDVDELDRAVVASLGETRRKGHLMCSCFAYAGLEV